MKKQREKLMITMTMGGKFGMRSRWWEIDVAAGFGGKLGASFSVPVLSLVLL